MDLVDTHCHIHSINSDADDQTAKLWAKAHLSAEEIIESAKNASVNKLICVGCDLEDSQAAIEFVKNRDNCFASVGIHPHEARRYPANSHLEDKLAILLKESLANKIIAVGECGLDYFYNHSPKEDQLSVLRIQLDLAVRYDLPLIFHVREAYQDFWPIFDSYKGKLRGVLHSFTDNETNLGKAIDSGLMIGVNGIATFMKQADQLAMIRAIPMSNLLLETDSPYLTPTPYRGTVNEPKHILTIAKFMAELRGDSLQLLSEATKNNANLLFGI